MKILIIDDSSLARKKIKMSLEEVGLADHEYYELSDGSQAIEMIKKENIDIVFTDIEMPNFDGIKLLETIKSQNIKVKVGVLTAHQTDAMKRQVLKLGARFYLTKPFNAETLKDVMKYLFKAPQKYVDEGNVGTWQLVLKLAVLSIDDNYILGEINELNKVLVEEKDLKTFMRALLKFAQRHSGKFVGFEPRDVQLTLKTPTTILTFEVEKIGSVMKNKEIEVLGKFFYDDTNVDDLLKAV